MRRRSFLPLPPTISSELLFQRFDADGDGILSRGELDLRPELFAVLDLDRSGTVEPIEVERRVAQVRAVGVDLCPDDFLGRWDLDKSGAIEPDELAGTVRLRLARHLPAK